MRPWKKNFYIWILASAQVLHFLSYAIKSYSGPGQSRWGAFGCGAWLWFLRSGFVILCESVHWKIYMSALPRATVLCAVEGTDSRADNCYLVNRLSQHWQSVWNSVTVKNVTIGPAMHTIQCLWLNGSWNCRCSRVSFRLSGSDHLISAFFFFLWPLEFTH